MAQYKSFAEVFKKIEKANKAAQVRAMNRATVSTKALFAKDMSKKLGVKSATLKRRVKIYKASNRVLSAIVSIGVSIPLAVHAFKGLTKKVVRTRIGKRWAVSYKSGGAKKQASSLAFITNINSRSDTNKVVLERKGDSQYPLQTARTNELIPATETMKPALQKHMNDTFEKVYREALVFFLKNMDKVGKITKPD